MTTTATTAGETMTTCDKNTVEPTTTTEVASAEEEKETNDEPITDSEGLLPHYDVILCGTGLVQSILASALCRAGQTVLHCDGQEYYGELDAVTTFYGFQEMIQQWNTTTNNKNCNMTMTHDSHDDTTSTTTNSTIPLIPSSSNRVILHSTYQVELPEEPKIQVGSQVQTTYGIGTVVSLPNIEKGTSMAVRLLEKENPTTLNHNDDDEAPNPDTKKEKQKDHDETIIVDSNNNHDETHLPPIVYIGSNKNNKNDDNVSLLLVNQEPSSIKAIRDIFHSNQLRNFALDVTPGLLYASGKAVKGLLTSNVAEYLEFKSMEGLTWLSKKNETKNNNDDCCSWQLSRVPCSKGDVFGTKLLPPMDKRRLMKFLQLTLDYATSLQTKAELAAYAAADANKATTTTTTTTIDEENDKEETKMSEGTPKEESGTTDTTTDTTTPVPSCVSTEEDLKSLNERMLQQGRSLARPQNKAVATDDLQVLEECIESESMDFETFLSQKQRLSPTVIKLVRHALALETSHTSTSTLQGMTQLCHHVQALGRYGTTAFLFPLYGSGELSQSFCRSAAVHGGTYLLRRSAKQIVLKNDNDDGTAPSVHGIVLGGEVRGLEDKKNQDQPPSVLDKTIMSKHVVVASEAIIRTSSTATEKQQHQQEQRILRRVSILRGKLIKDDKDPDQRHVILIPPKTVGNNSYAIHGITVDHSVNVAPRVSEYGGCTVLHLTTTVDVPPTNETDNENNVTVDDSIMDKAIMALIEASTSSGDSDDAVEEIFQATFSYPITTSTAESENNNLTEGLHVCHHGEQNLAVDAAFEQAKSIFETICPNVEFLELSEKMDTEIKERFGDVVEEDEEQMVLESAMNMLGVASKEEEKEEEETKVEVTSDEELSSTEQKKTGMDQVDTEDSNEKVQT